MGQRKTIHLTVARRQRIRRKDLAPQYFLPGPYPGDISSYKTLLLKLLSTISSRLHWYICFGRPLKTNHSNDKQVNLTTQDRDLSTSIEENLFMYVFSNIFMMVCRRSGHGT